MNHFEYKDQTLFCEDVCIKEIADKVGTPFFLYSHATLTRHFKAFDDSFSNVDHLVCYSVKANSNIAILNLFFNLGGGADIVSGGELFRALRAGADPRKIVYSGVGKSEKELRFALSKDILMFNVESSQELDLLDSVAADMNKKAPISLRVNPDVDPQTHPYISTGLKSNKFGIAAEQALEVYRYAAGLKNIDVIGIDCHIGSQLTLVEPFVDALKRVKKLIFALRDEGIHIQYLDIGGGLGVTYDDEQPPHPTQYGAAIYNEVKDMDITLVLEPGRVIACNAGILVTKALYTKKGEEKEFIIADAAMNDLARPSLYGSFQDLTPVDKIDRKSITADVVGPICESGDFLAKDRTLTEVNPGELIAVRGAGAYGFSMSSNYNSRPRAAEVLVKGSRFEVIRERETYDDLIRGESIPEL